MKIVIVDNDCARRAEIVQSLDGVNNNTVFDFKEISQSNFENGEFDVALLHQNNPEAGMLLNEIWESKDVRLIFFSGGYSQAISRDDEDELVYVSEGELRKRLPDLNSILGSKP